MTKQNTALALSAGGLTFDIFMDPAFMLEFTVTPTYKNLGVTPKGETTQAEGEYPKVTTPAVLQYV
jgi:hypothetical protein